jgi:methylglyoxal reductase
MWGGADEPQSIDAIRASLDAGVTLIDTAPAYGLGKAERIVGKALAGRRSEVVIATKCGLVWHTDKGNYFFNQEEKKSIVILAATPLSMKRKKAFVA